MVAGHCCCSSLFVVWDVWDVVCSFGVCVYLYIFKEMSWDVLLLLRGVVFCLCMCACVFLLSEPSDFVLHPIAKAFANCE